MEELKYDIAIVGGGIVGLATAYQIQKEFPKLNLIILEKESKLASHQTGRNSGVIHSGLYYKPDSLRAKNCVKGREQLIEFAKERIARFKAPKYVEFGPLPKTATGKIQKYVLREKEWAGKEKRIQGSL